MYWVLLKLVSELCRKMTALTELAAQPLPAVDRRTLGCAIVVPLVNSKKAVRNLCMQQDKEKAAVVNRQS